MHWPIILIDVKKAHMTGNKDSHFTDVEVSETTKLIPKLDEELKPLLTGLSPSESAQPYRSKIAQVADTARKSAGLSKQ